MQPLQSGPTAAYLTCPPSRPADLIRAGSFRPGANASSAQAVLGITAAAAVFASPTGLLGGLVGAAGPDFVPSDMAATSSALYRQSRFFHAQYLDVRRDVLSGTEGALFRKLGGSQDGATGLITYGKSMPGQILVISAFTTVNGGCNTTWERANRTNCCNPDGTVKSSPSYCANSAHDSMIYREQGQLYATTLAAAGGWFTEAPTGSEHTFPYTDPYFHVVAEEVLAKFSV